MSLRPTRDLRPDLPLKQRSPPSMMPPMSAITQAALIESHALLRGTRELLIRHGGEVYRLRHTRNDKLILTK